MADQYDILARTLGVPDAAARLRAMGGGGAPAAPAPAAPAGPRPGDPGFIDGLMAPPPPAPGTAFGPPPPPVAPVAAPLPPPGPRPGDRGWNLADAMPPPPAPAAPVGRHGAPPAPARALSAAEFLSHDGGTSEANALYQNQRAGAGSSRVMSADAARQLVDNNRAQVQGLSDVEKQNGRDANLAGATFAHGPGTGVAGPMGAPSRPVMVSPGGRKPASWQVQEGQQVPREAEDAAELGTQRRREAAGYDLEVAQRAGEADRAYLEGLSRAGERYEQEKRARAEQYASEYDQGMGRLEELREAVRTQEVDPYKGAAGNSGLTKFLGILAAAVGGYASAGRGPNMGMQAFNAMIEGNIRQQEAETAKLERGLKGENNFLGQLKTRFGDVEEAKAAARVAYLERAKTELAAKMAQPEIQGSQALSAYERAMAALDDELADKTMKFSLLKQDKVVRHDVNAPPVYAGGGGGKAGAPDPLFVPTGPGGQGFQARSEKEAQSARGVITAEENIVPKIERLIELRKKAGLTGRGLNKLGYETEELAEIKSLQGMVAKDMRELSASSPGAMDKGMQDLAAQIQGDWTAVGNNPESAANALVREIRRQKVGMMRGQGAQAEQQTLTRDAKGNVVTQSVGQASYASPAAPMPKVKRAGE